MKKLAREFGEMNLIELGKKEKELENALMIAESKLRGGLTNRMGYMGKEDFSIKKIKKTLAVLLTIKSLKESG